jgi:hypothetical protein
METATRYRLTKASVLEFRSTRVFLWIPRCYRLGAATRGCFVKFIPAKLVNQTLLFVLLLGGCFALTGISMAQNQYYVATTGNDSNNGTSPSTPWATIAHADAALAVGSSGTCNAGSGWLSVSNAGACVHVASGTYSGNISTSKAGAATTRVVYISDTKWGAYLVGSTCGVWINSGNYVDVAGFDVTGSCSTGINWDNASHGMIIGNRVHDLPGTGGYAGILVDCCNYNTTDNWVVGNLVDNIGPFAQTNLIHGIYVAGNNSVVENNIVTRAAAACITTYHGSTHEVISNNTVANCGHYGIQISADGAITSNDYTTVDNNIVVNVAGFGIQEWPSVGTHNVYNHNIVYNNTGGNFSLISGTQSGNITLTSSQFSTLFVSYTGTISGNYQLGAGSTAVANGTTNCAPSPALVPCVPNTDIVGVIRPSGPTLDIGAYQHQGSVPSGLTAKVQ